MAAPEIGASSPQSTDAKARELPDELIDPVWIVYFDGRPLEINRAVCGYTLEEWRHGGKAFFERIFTPESLTRMRAATRQVRTSRRPLHNVELALRAHGDPERLFHFLVNYQPVLDAAGEVVGVRGDARNITDLRRTGSAYAGDAGLTIDLLQNSPDVIWLLHFDGRPGYVNHGFAGYSAQEWAHGGLGHLIAALGEDSRKRLDRAIGYLRESGESVRNLELELRTRAGAGTVRMLATFSPSFDTVGCVAGAQATLRDITELAQTRAALKRSESRFRDLVENAHDLVWTVDAHGNWLYLNQAARQIYGCEAAELIGRPFAEVTHPDHRDKDREMFETVLRGHQASQHETIHLHRDGSLRYLSFNVQPYMDENWEIVGAMGMARDITEQKLYQNQLEHLADHDVLTGLHNRHFFETEITRALGRVVRGGSPDGLLYIDVDNFKYVNDTLGHAAGDRLLLEIAQTLRARLRQGDVLARFGGDEFTVLLEGLGAALLPEIAQSFHNLFRGFTFLQDGQVFDVRVSVGATLITAQTASMGEALAQADLACTLAKSRGRNQAHVYDVTDRSLASMVSDVSWTRKINEAIERGHFVLHYQPVVRLRDSEISHYEVLLRMRGPDGELIAPGLFLPAAERFGLIHAIDRWVVEHAIRELAAHQRSGTAVAFAVNLSARVLDDREFLVFLGQKIEDAALEPRRLTFELTETAAIAHMASAREFIEHLNQLGCRVALDDFGSGFSSYSYLKHLPVDYLKIDGGFIRQLARDTQDQAIVQSMNQVAHALGKETIAECVEDDACLDLLREYGVDYAQGYYLGRPADRPNGV